MGLPRRLTADAAAGLLLVGAATVLLATPYDGGSCSNVLAAYALPAASLPDEKPPARPSALADAERAVSAANTEVAELESEQAAVDELYAAAEKARTAANDAQSDLWESSFSYDYSSDSSLAELDVDFAENAVESAEDWLAYVQEEMNSEWAFYTQADVDDAQADVDEARAELAEAEAALSEAQSEEAAKESAAANAEATAEELDAAAEAAEQAATDAAADLYDRQRAAEDRLYSARGLVAELEAGHAVEMAEWSHDRRVAADDVTAQNNVRESCRENGGWRAGVAVLDVLLVAALVLRKWAPRLPLQRVRLPWRRA
jgi:hypothetical protein